MQLHPLAVTLLEILYHSVLGMLSCLSNLRNSCYFFYLLQQERFFRSSSVRSPYPHEQLLSKSVLGYGSHKLGLKCCSYALTAACCSYVSMEPGCRERTRAMASWAARPCQTR